MTNQSNRTAVNFRLGVAGVEKIDKIAKDAGVSRSDVFRAGLAVALANPKALGEAIEKIKEQW